MPFCIYITKNNSYEYDIEDFVESHICMLVPGTYDGLVLAFTLIFKIGLAFCHRNNIQYMAPEKKTRKLVQPGFLVLIFENGCILYYYSNCSIMTAEFIVFL